MDTVRDIEGAYWGLIANEEQLRVEEKSLETAKALLEQTKTQYEVGVVSKVEVTEAEAGVAAREFSRITAEATYLTAQDRLIDLVLGPNLTAESKLMIEPTDRPEDYVAYDIDVEEAVRKGLENRPELAVAQREIERQEIQLKFAKNQRLPQLDLVGEYGNEGLSGSDPNPDLRPPPCDAPIARRSPPARARQRLQGQLRQLLHERRGEPLGRRGRLLDPDPQHRRRATGSRSRSSSCAARWSQKRRVEQQIVLEVRLAARNLSRGAGGHRGLRSAGWTPPRSSCGPRRSASSTASRRPSTCCCASATWWAPRPRRSSPSGSTGPR